jgi:hypothetical protein
MDAHERDVVALSYGLQQLLLAGFEAFDSASIHEMLSSVERRCSEVKHGSHGHHDRYRGAFSNQGPVT